MVEPHWPGQSRLGLLYSRPASPDSTDSDRAALWSMRDRQPWTGLYRPSQITARRGYAYVGASRAQESERNHGEALGVLTASTRLRLRPDRQGRALLSFTEQLATLFKSLWSLQVTIFWAFGSSGDT